MWWLDALFEQGTIKPAALPIMLQDLASCTDYFDTYDIWTTLLEARAEPEAMKWARLIDWSTRDDEEQNLFTWLLVKHGAWGNLPSCIPKERLIRYLDDSGRRDVMLEIPGV
jgi:hypothetical protein